MNLTISEILNVLMKEMYLKRYFVLIAFVIVSFSILAVGTVWPKKYKVSAVIQVDNRNMLEPLMKGAAVKAEVKDQAKNSREILMSSKILDQTIKQAGWVGEQATPLEIKMAKEGIIGNTRVITVGDNLIRIIFHSGDPNRTFLTVKSMTALFLQEGKNSKLLESRSAYEFIESQVNQYAAKLTGVDDEIKKLLESAPDARPGSQDKVTSRVSQLQSQIENSLLNLREEEIKKAALDKQLADEAMLSVSQAKEAQLSARINQLELDLENLLLIYTNTYPDVIRKTEQIEELKKNRDKEITRRMENLKNKNKPKENKFNSSFSKSAIYESIKSNLSETETRIVTLKTRLKEMDGMLKTEYDRLKRIQESESVMTGLTRDYDVNQEIYQDLLKRLENARVSRSLGAEEQGTTFKIQEPAEMPLRPSGLHFTHFLLMGAAGGLLFPIVIIYMLMIYDGKIRVSRVVTEACNIVVLAEIPHYQTQTEKKIDSRDVKIAILVLTIVVAVFSYFTFLNMQGRL